MEVLEHAYGGEARRYMEVCGTLAYGDKAISLGTI